jgi:hypothetical protein
VSVALQHPHGALRSFLRALGKSVESHHLVWYLLRFIVRRTRTSLDEFEALRDYMDWRLKNIGAGIFL